jgi:regulator of sigma E protease
MELKGYWSLLFQIPVGLIGLSFMVFVHELGHFLVAKWNGVKVHTFSIGFGKKLIRIQRGDTEYCLSAIPFGGYVAMAGENPDDGGYGNTDAFREQSISARIAIAAAGPIFNLVFAILILFGLYLVGVQEPVKSLVVGTVDTSSTAYSSGLRPGDQILTLDEEPVRDWESLTQQVAMEAGTTLNFRVQRGNETLELQITPELNPRYGIALPGFYGEAEITVAKLIPGKPAQASGVESGDHILTVDSVAIPSATALVEMINGSQGRTVELALVRGADTLRKTVQPIKDEESGRYIIGIYPGITMPTEWVKRGPADAATAAVAKTWDYATLVFRTFGKIFTGQVQLKALSGPIGIVQMISTSLRQGTQEFLMFMALLNTNLGVLNLLPLAITDGGLILFLLLEAIRRKPLSLKTQGMINRVGLSFFILMFLFVTFHDILRIPWFLN